MKWYFLLFFVANISKKCVFYMTRKNIDFVIFVFRIAFSVVCIYYWFILENIIEIYICMLWDSNYYFALGRHICIAKAKKCGICETVKVLVENDGAIALYRGFIPTLTKSIPAGAINYVVFELAQKFLHQHINWVFVSRFTFSCGVKMCLIYDYLSVVYKRVFK